MEKALKKVDRVAQIDGGKGGAGGGGRVQNSAARAVQDPGAVSVPGGAEEEVSRVWRTAGNSTQGWVLSVS